MPPEDRQAIEPLEVKPHLRFSLRTLLIVTTILALTAAVAGWCCRQMPESAKYYLLAIWTGELVSGLLCSMVGVWLRQWMISRIGNTILATSCRRPPTGIWNKLPLRATASLLILITFVGFVPVVVARDFSDEPATFASASFLVMTGGVLGYFLTMVLFSFAVSDQEVVIGANGIGYVVWFFSWKRVKHIASHPNRSGMRGVHLKLIGGLGFRLFRFHIPEDQIPEVDAYIAERLAQAHGGNPE